MSVSGFAEFVVVNAWASRLQYSVVAVSVFRPCRAPALPGHRGSSRSIRMSLVANQDFPKIFRLAAQGKLKPDPMSAPDFPVEKINDAFEASASRSAIHPRIVFDTVA